jgi:hypothetical protein
MQPLRKCVHCTAARACSARAIRPAHTYSLNTHNVRLVELHALLPLTNLPVVLYAPQHAYAQLSTADSHVQREPIRGYRPQQQCTPTGSQCSSPQWVTRHLLLFRCSAHAVTQVSACRRTSSSSCAAWAACCCAAALAGAATAAAATAACCCCGRQSAAAAACSVAHLRQKGAVQCIACYLDDVSAPCVHCIDQLCVVAVDDSD